MPACDAFVVLLCPIRACSSCAARAPARSVDTSKDDSCGATMLSGPTGPAKTRGLRLAVDPRHFEVRAAVKRDGALIRRSNSDSRHCRRLPYHDRGRKRRGRRFTGLDASRVTTERSGARGRPQPRKSSRAHGATHARRHGDETACPARRERVARARVARSEF